MTTNITFARLGDRGFMAGTSMDAIIADARAIFPRMPQDTIEPVSRTDLPPAYQCSARAVENVRDWESTGTYLLIKNMERSETLCNLYFSKERTHAA